VGSHLPDWAFTIRSLRTSQHNINTKPAASAKIGNAVVTSWNLTTLKRRSLSTIINEPGRGSKTSEPVATAKTANQSLQNPEPAASAQAAKVELVQTAEGLKAEPAKRASSSPAASTNGQNQTETTFAPKYLIRPARKSSSSRMNPFLDMARQVKTPG